MFDHYHIVSPADLQEAARKLDVARAQAPTEASNVVSITETRAEASR